MIALIAAALFMTTPVPRPFFEMDPTIHKLIFCVPEPGSDDSKCKRRTSAPLSEALLCVEDDADKSFLVCLRYSDVDAGHFAPIMAKKMEHQDLVVKHRP